MRRSTVWNLPDRVPHPVKIGTRSRILVASAVLLALFARAGGQSPLTEVHQDFGRDPGWEAVNNRIECNNCPTVVQDFGWRQNGLIGGKVWQSTTPAYYGMPFGRPLTFHDAFSAEGLVALPTAEGNGAAYIGFFNSRLQGWRPWSSLGLRLVTRGNSIMATLDYMTAQWGAGGRELDVEIPANGSSHMWRFSYDPNSTPPPWTDLNLRACLSAQRQTAEQVHEKMRKPEPRITLEEVRSRLSRALAQGIVSFFPRANGKFWTLDKHEGSLRGAIRVQFDKGQVYTTFLSLEHRDAPVAMDRFGIFNVQLYHRWLELYVSELKVNGTQIDLSSDPKWDGLGNHTTFVERDFQRQNFGYSETNWAGKQAGEIGGTFYRTEPEDPLQGYYADDVGLLTLNDPISFSGNIAFVGGATDAGMFFGYFNRQEKMRPIKDPQEGSPLNDTLGIEIDGPTRIGYYFSAVCSPKRDAASKVNGPIFLPDRKPHSFRFKYDPKANDGIGGITVQLDRSEFALTLTPKQRAVGAHFDRFGLVSKRTGGKFVELYFDDLTYTARRAPGEGPARHESKTVFAPYPLGGRQY